MTLAFRQPHREHLHRRRVAIEGKGVSSGKPIASKVRVDPRWLIELPHDTYTLVTPCPRR